jgi:hypothetical protein
MDTSFFEDRYFKIPAITTGDSSINSRNQERRYELNPHKKKPNPNKKNPVKYCLDTEVIINTTLCNSCEHKFSCFAYFSAFEIIEIRKSFCYQDGLAKNESQIYESLINYLLKHQVKNYESLPHDQVHNYYSHILQTMVMIINYERNNKIITIKN